MRFGTWYRPVSLPLCYCPISCVATGTLPVNPCQMTIRHIPRWCLSTFVRVLYRDVLHSLCYFQFLGCSDINLVEISAVFSISIFVTKVIMGATKKNIVFDVVGTLVSYDKILEGLETRLGDRLRAEGIKPKLLVYTWLEAAEREYTYLSMSHRYKTFSVVMEAIFFRMLWMAGISEPRDFATESDIKFIMAEHKKLEMRPGAKECVQKLRDAGFTVWAFTAGDLSRVGGYFTAAGVEMPAENLISCDSIKIGKPSPDAYAPLLKQLNLDGQPWFAAAHMWDVSAARSIGYVSIRPKSKFFQPNVRIDLKGHTAPSGRRSRCWNCLEIWM